MTIWTKQSQPTRLPEAALDPAGWSGPVAMPGLLARLRRFVKRHAFMVTVLLPTLLAAGYLYGFAAPQFEFGSPLPGPRPLRRRWRRHGRRGGDDAERRLRPASEDAMGVRDYLQSHDAVAALAPARPPGRDVPPAGGRPGRPALVGGAECRAAAGLFSPHGDRRIRYHQRHHCAARPQLPPRGQQDHRPATPRPVRGAGERAEPTAAGRRTAGGARRGDAGRGPARPPPSSASASSARGSARSTRRGPPASPSTISAGWKGRSPRPAPSWPRRSASPAPTTRGCCSCAIVPRGWSARSPRSASAWAAVPTASRSRSASSNG